MRRRAGGFFVLLIGLFLSLPLTRRNNVVKSSTTTKLLDQPMTTVGGKVGQAQFGAFAMVGEDEGGKWSKSVESESCLDDTFILWFTRWS